MDYILIVSDRLDVIALLEKKLYEYIHDCDIIIASDYKEAQTYLDSYTFKISIVNFTLPDAPYGEIIDLVSEKKIPTIVMAESMSDDIQQMILSKNIIEMVGCNDAHNITHIVKVTKRILNNYTTKVLVVDDTQSSRKLTVKYLKKLHLQIYEASNGKEALEILHKFNNTIPLVVTDYRMPEMDGMELTMKLRETYNKDQLCIIALSSTEDLTISTKFLKRGANDYLKKPFNEDEIAVRVNANLEMLELFQSTSDLANKDYLTGAYNRRFFFESGKAILKKAIRNKKSLFVAIVDIDHFKQINDTFGHDIGDEALKAFSHYLNNSFRSSDLVARFGGEEFCVLLEDISKEKAVAMFETLRNYFETHTVQAGPHELNFTVSIGIFHGLLDDLGDMIKEADMGLYAAKAEGRNKIIVNNESIHTNLLPKY